MEPSTFPGLYKPVIKSHRDGKCILNKEDACHAYYIWRIENVIYLALIVDVVCVYMGMGERDRERREGRG